MNLLQGRGLARAAWAANSLRDHLSVARAVDVAPTEAVLDVGSGGTPFPRANVLMDKFPDDGYHRHGQAVRADRPFVIGDVQRIPFADQAFDVVICSHVLEHVEDPSVAIRELERVAPRGYVETPSASWEKLQGFPFHRWLVSFEDGILVFREKRAALFDPELRHWFESMERMLGIKERIWFARRRIGVYCSVVWEGSIPHRVIRDGAGPRTASDVDVEVEPSDLGFDAPAPRLRLIDRLIDAQARRARRRTEMSWDALLSILRCPACRAPVTADPFCVTCEECGRTYRRDRHGRPWLLSS